MLYALVGATAFLLLGVSWVGRAWKLVVALAAIATLVGALQAWDLRAAWLAAKSVSVAYPYAGWIISMPIQV